MTKKSEIIDAIAEHMMVTTRGYKKDEWPLEWDKDSHDSQISMVIEDVEEVLEFLEKKYGYKFGSEGPTGSETVTNSYIFSPGVGGGGGSGTVRGTTTMYYYPPTAPEPEIDGVQTDVDVRIRTRKNPNLSELGEFLERMALLGCEPTTEVVGSLSYTKRIEDSMAHRITCGDCGEDDILLSDHSCN